MPRPTRRAFSLAAAALLLFFLAGSSQAGWLYVLAASFVGVLAAGFVFPVRLIAGLSARREAPKVATAGDDVAFVVCLTNNSARGRGPVAGTDMLLSPRSFIASAVAPGRSVRFALSAAAAKRGIIESGQIRIATAAPFGVATAARSFEAPSRLTIHPRWVPLVSFPVLEAASTPHEALHERRRSYRGGDFFGLREYRPGDSLRAVHWPSSARHGGLLVREFEEQPGTRLGIFIDGTVLGGGADTTFEQAISCAASVVMYALGAGHPVQLFCDTPKGVEHLFEPSRAQALDWMAGLAEGPGRGLRELAGYAAAHIFRRSTNVLIFPATHQAADEVDDAVAVLQNAGTRVIAIVISARSFSRHPGVLEEPDEIRLVQRLSAMRVIVYCAGSGRDLSDCLREPAA